MLGQKSVPRDFITPFIIKI